MARGGPVFSPGVSLCVVVGHVFIIIIFLYFYILLFVDAPPGGDIMFRLFPLFFYANRCLVMWLPRSLPGRNYGLRHRRRGDI